MVAQRPLEPLAQVRILARQPALLLKNGLAFICVDESQGFKSSMPIADTVLVRCHGRNTEIRESTRATANQRFNYRYSEDELVE